MCCLLIPTVLIVIIIIAGAIISWKGETDSETAAKWKRDAITTLKMLAIATGILVAIGIVIVIIGSIMASC